jgi:hypothetical protein
MYNYALSFGNPEGIDFSFDLIHEKAFSKEEFQDICESAIVEVLDKQWEIENFVSISCIDTDLLISRLKTKGFVFTEYQATYFLEPYWGQDSIKNPKLLGWTKAKER